MASLSRVHCSSLESLQDRLSKTIHSLQDCLEILETQHDHSHYYQEWETQLEQQSQEIEARLETLQGNNSHREQSCPPRFSIFVCEE